MSGDMRIRERVLIGWDVGQVVDPSAVVVGERWRRETLVRDEASEQTRIEAAIAGRPLPASGEGWQVAERWYEVKLIERFSMGSRYPEQVERLAGIYEDRELWVGDTPPTLVMDATGVGRAVVDMAHARGLAPKAIVFTSGSVVSQSDGFYHVPTVDLCATVQVLLQTGRLRIAPMLPLAEALADELREFRVEFNEATGHARFAAGRGHDDLVMALACAAWYGEKSPTWRASDFATIKR